MNLDARPNFHFWSTVGSAIWFAILAGWLNAFATVALLYERASHMSGRATDLGRGFTAFFAYPEETTRTAFYQEALIVAIILTGFVVGGTVGAILLNAIGFGKTILVVGALIGISAIKTLMGLPPGVENVFSFERAIWGLILPLAMGIQNAGTTLVAMGRTTHLTGTLTDLGIAISKREHKNTLRFFSVFAGFTFGAGIGFLTPLYIRSPFIQLLILTAIFIVTGSFYSHPAVARKLSLVVCPGRAPH